MKITPHFYDLCGKRRDMELRRFLPKAQRFLANVPQFGEHTTFSRQKVPQSGKRRRRRGTLQDGALQYGHQSVALLAGESGTIYAMFSSATVPRLLHSF